eukprot:Phypoly_transcript_17839.p1 GENE.Phypoly_transcript_17839~~Phypoly_transcript_17839.p1  ORF type:complete len:185 (-),score=25.40 Phypoly_transcript_17839:102-656(-)
MSFTIHDPGSKHPSLQKEHVPYDKFMGSWFVVWSTLPLWKGKKDVKITYTPLASNSVGALIDDLVEYRKASAPSTSSPSTVRGIDTRDDSANGATWNWRGKGLLMIASSHWEIIGYDTESEDPEWAVTHFSKTLFTPAGLDIYMRQPLTSAEGRAVVDGIVAVLQAKSGNVGDYAKNGFVVGSV